MENTLIPADTVVSGITNRLKAIIVQQLGIEPDRIVDSASFSEDLNAESIEIVKIVMEEFDLEVPDADVVLAVDLRHRVVRDRITLLRRAFLTAHEPALGGGAGSFERCRQPFQCRLVKALAGSADWLGDISQARLWRMLLKRGLLLLVGVFEVRLAARNT